MKSGLSYDHIHHFEDGGDAGSDGGDSGGEGPSGGDTSSVDAGMASIAESNGNPDSAPGAPDSGSNGNDSDPINDEGALAQLGVGLSTNNANLSANLGMPGGPGTATNGMTAIELANLQNIGLGNMDISPTQTVNQAAASLGVSNMTPNQIASILGVVAPPLGAGISLANSIMGLVSGQTTVGQAVANLGLNAVANAIGINPGTLSGIVNLNPGATLASLAGPAGSVVSGALGLANPGSNLASTINNALGTAPSGPSNTSAIASAINSALGTGPTSVAAAPSAPASGGLSIAAGEPVSGSTSQTVGSSTPTSPESSGSSSAGLMGILGGLAATGLFDATGSGKGSTTASLDLSNPWLNTSAQELKPTEVAVTNTPETLKLAQLQNIYNQIDPELLDLLVARGVVPAAIGGSIHQFAEGGSSSTTCTTWGPMGKYMPKFSSPGNTMIATGPARRQAALSQLQQIRPGFGQAGGMARGGLPEKYRQAAPEGHNPEFITGLTGFYANGRGTGQSDDIPAMLHDGDYVMDADTVAALGDGSSKAGAQALEGFRHEVPHQMSAGGKAVPAKIADGEYVFPEAFVTALGNGDNKRGAKMLDTIRENLRAHKRSAPTSKIPPKALSPLDYLNKSKG